MKLSCTVILLLAVTLLCIPAALAQSPIAQAQASANSKHFDKDGVTFDYPNGWNMEDRSTADAQQLILSRADSDAQIRVAVYRRHLATPDDVARAKTSLVDPYVASVTNSFTQAGGNPSRTPAANTQVGGAQAEGVHIRAVLSGVPGEAAVYWTVLGNRLVVLTFFGPDQALKQATPALDSIRNSFHVEEARPAATPSPSPAPSRSPSHG